MSILRGTRILLLIAAMGLAAPTLTGCGDETTGDSQTTLDVSISASVEQGVAPLEVTLTSVVTGTTEPIYAWDFGDGGTSAEANPVYTFATAGTYTVALTVTTAEGGSATDSLEITAIAPLSVTVAADPTEGLAPLLVSVSSTADGGVPPYSYAWNFGDGGAAEQSSASHLYLIAGAFDVELTVTDAEGNTATSSVTINVADDHTPVAAISADPTVGVAPLDVTFLGTAIGGDEPLTFAWDFGDGETDDVQSPTHTFLEPGTHTVVLIVTDADGDTSSDTIDIAVGTDDQPVVEITADPTMGVDPLDVAFMAHVAGGNVPYTYGWDFDGDANIDSEVPNPTTTLAAGVHTVTVTVTDVDGDEATDTIDITVEDDTTPVVTVTATPDTGQAPLTVDFQCSATGLNLPWTIQWDFGNGEVSDLANPTHTYTTAGLYTATCRVIDDNGDVGEASVTIDVLADTAPAVTIQADPVVGIAALDVDFVSNVTGGDAPFTYAWDFGDSGTDTVANPTYTFATAGTFTVVVVVTDADGDEATDTIEISVTTDDLPVVEITAEPMAGIEPLDVRFVANVAGGNAPVTIAWDFDADGTPDSTQATTTNTFAAGSHTVSVTVTDANGDTDTDSVVIDVEAEAAPTVTATGTPTSGFAPLGVAFDCVPAGGNLPYTFLWEFGDGQTSQLEDPAYTYTQVGDFTATCTVTDANGDSAVAPVAISVQPDLIPSVAPTANPGSGVVPLTVDFAANATGGNAPLTYAWEFGDGGTDTVANPTYTYNAPGTYTATVTVTDADSDVAMGTVMVDAIDQPPTAVATITAGACSVPGQTMVVLDASTSADPEGGTLTYEWVFVALPVGSSARFNSSTVVSPSFTPDVDGTYEARVFVEDGTHRIASTTVLITADSMTGTINVLAGSPQTVEVDQAFPVNPEVEVLNGCGTVIGGKQVNWMGTGVSPGNAGSVSNAAGVAFTTLRAGTVAGPATLEAESDGVTATFTFTLNPGPPETLTMLSVPSQVVSNTADVMLTFAVADRFGNPTTGVDVTFDADLWGAGELTASPGACGTGSSSVSGVTTSGGTATLYVCSTQAGDLPVSFRVTSGGAIRAISLFEVVDDFESGSNFNWLNGWEIGAPTSGPGAAVSGNNVLATVLDGDYVPFEWYQGEYPLPNIPFTIDRGTLTFQHWYDIGTGDGFCWDAGGWLEVDFFGTVAPVGGYPANCTPWGRGYAGQSSGWVQAQFDYPGGPFPINNFRLNMISDWGPFGPPQPAAGWYIDDLEFQLQLRDGGVVSFVAGPPAILSAVTEAQGSACANGRARVMLEDQFNNRIASETIDLSVDNAAEIVALWQGSGFGGPGASTTADTDQNGELVIEIDPMGTNSDVILTAAVAADATVNASATVASTPADESGWCNDGVDNDCNGPRDCQDAVCSPTPACIGEFCGNPEDVGVVSGGYGQSATFCNHSPDEFLGCWGESLPDYFYTFEVDLDGTYEICTDFGGSELYWTFGDSGSCPDGASFCPQWASSCDRFTLTPGQPYTLGFFSWDPGCFPYDWQVNFQCLGDGLLYVSDPAECCSGDPDGDGVCGIGAACDPEGNVCDFFSIDNCCTSCQPVNWMPFPNGMCCWSDGTDYLSMGPGVDESGCCNGDGDGDGRCGGGPPICGDPCDCGPDETCGPFGCELAFSCFDTCDGDLACDFWFGGWMCAGGGPQDCCAPDGFPYGDPSECCNPDDDGDGACGGGGPCLPDGVPWGADPSECCNGDDDGDGICGGGGPCLPDGVPWGVDPSECCNGDPDGDGICGGGPPICGDPCDCGPEETCGPFGCELAGSCADTCNPDVFCDAVIAPGWMCGGSGPMECCAPDGIPWGVDPSECCNGDPDGDGICGGGGPCLPDGVPWGVDPSECCNGDPDGDGICGGGGPCLPDGFPWGVDPSECCNGDPDGDGVCGGGALCGSACECDASYNDWCGPASTCEPYPGGDCTEVCDGDMYCQDMFGLDACGGTDPSLDFCCWAPGGPCGSDAECCFGACTPLGCL